MARVRKEGRLGKGAQRWRLQGPWQKEEDEGQEHKHYGSDE